MTDILAIIGGVGTLGLGITCVVLAIRNGGLKVDANEADRLREAAEKTAKKVSKEFDAYRHVSEEAVALLEKELEQYENRELEAIDEEADQARRIRMRRSLVSRLLSKAPDDEGGGSEGGVREEGTTDAETSGDN